MCILPHCVYCKTHRYLNGTMTTSRTCFFVSVFCSIKPSVYLLPLLVCSSFSIFVAIILGERNILLQVILKLIFFQVKDLKKNLSAHSVAILLEN